VKTQDDSSNIAKSEPSFFHNAARREIVRGNGWDIIGVDPGVKVSGGTSEGKFRRQFRKAVQKVIQKAIQEARWR